jgi:hypothetical protein
MTGSFGSASSPRKTPDYRAKTSPHGQSNGNDAKNAPTELTRQPVHAAQSMQCWGVIGRMIADRRAIRDALSANIFTIAVLAFTEALETQVCAIRTCLVLGKDANDQIVRDYHSLRHPPLRWVGL